MEVIDIPMIQESSHVGVMMTMMIITFFHIKDIVHFELIPQPQ
jgi:hypothetical protein